jgi:glycosyltransferase involved in cell wall biosynthesis
MIVCDFFLKYGSQQALALKRLGHDVAILLRLHSHEFGGSDAERDEIMTRLRQDGIRLFVVPGRVRSPSAAPALLRIRRDLHRWAPHVVHVHENHDPRLAALTRGFRTVFTVHDPVQHPGYKPLPRLQAWAFNRWFRRAECFVVHGAALADELAQIMPRARTMVIPHGVSPRAQPLSPPESASVLLFGRLEQYKGVDVLVEAIHQVWELRPETTLTVAGAGPAARLVPDDPRITLRPEYVPEAEVDNLLAGASLVVLPYTQASQSGVGVLAIAAGVPVLVSDLGALPELAYSSSFVVPAGDSTALADAIVRHVDAGEDVRRAVLQHARANFSWEHAARLTTELYCDLISGGPRPYEAPNHPSSVAP